MVISIVTILLGPISQHIPKAFFNKRYHTIPVLATPFPGNADLCCPIQYPLATSEY